MDKQDGQDSGLEHGQITKSVIGCAFEVINHPVKAPRELPDARCMHCRSYDRRRSATQAECAAAGIGSTATIVTFTHTAQSQLDSSRGSRQSA